MMNSQQSTVLILYYLQWVHTGGGDLADVAAYNLNDPHGQHHFEIGFNHRGISNRFNSGDLVVPFWLLQEEITISVYNKMGVLTAAHQALLSKDWLDGTALTASYGAVSSLLSKDWLDGTAL